MPNSEAKATATPICDFCGELVVFLPSYPNHKKPKILVHDSCKPFYILLNKLNKR